MDRVELSGLVSDPAVRQFVGTYSRPSLTWDDLAFLRARLDVEDGAPPGDLFRLMSAEQQQALFENTARAIDGASQQSIEKHIEHCTTADPAYGEGVRKAIEALKAGQVDATDVNSDSM